MSDKSDFHELIERHLRGELSDEEKERLAELLDSDSEARREFVDEVQWDTRVAEVLREIEARREAGQSPAPADDSGSLAATQEPAHRGQTVNSAFHRVLLSIAGAIIVLLSVSLYFQRTKGEQPIARIAGLGGSLQWTGDGGRVYYDLGAGAELPGGTVEGLAPGSWFELEFHDGSTVTISGSSILTFSDHGQKVLHLKEGNLAANVKSQPAGQPMLIYTRSAMLEVMGTQFEVEAGLTATMLNVSEGKVRVQRLSDGSVVEVPAKHRVVAAADRALLPAPVPGFVTSWHSQLRLGPIGTQGKWLPRTETQDARLGAVAYTTRLGKTIYTAAFGVSRGDRPPVILLPASRIRVRGRIRSSHEVYVGVTVRHPNGEFAGNFQTIRPAGDFPSGADFEVVLRLRDFRLDPSLTRSKNKLPKSPYQLVVESLWCHTLGERAGLEISDVELIPPANADPR